MFYFSTEIGYKESTDTIVSNLSRPF